MPLNMRATLIFNDAKAGWSETWYKANVPSLTDGLKDAQKLAKARGALVGLQASIEAVRVSDEAENRDSLLDFNPDHVSKEAESKSSDTPWNCFLARVSAGSRYRRSVYLRGIPDDWIQRSLVEDTQFTMVEAFVKAWTAFGKHLVDNNWCIRALSREADTPEVKITDIRRAAGDVNIWTEVVAPGLNVTAGDHITVRGAKGTLLKGAYPVFSSNANVVTIKRPMDEKDNYVGGGMARKRVYALFPVTDYELIRPAKRDTGRAFFVPRGRRSARRK